MAGGGAGAGEERGYGREGGECGRDGAGEERGQLEDNRKALNTNCKAYRHDNST